MVITDADRQDRVAEVADDVPTLRSTLVAGRFARRGVGDRIRASRPDVEPVGPDEIGALFFTSGTTGPSKAVATTWHYLFTAAATVAASWELEQGDTLWTAMPLFHLSAAPTVLAPMLIGGTSVLAAAFHPGEVWDEIRNCGAVGFAGAGAMVSMLWSLPPDPRDAELGIRFISAAPIAADMYREIEQRYRCRDRDDVRHDRSVPDRLQGSFRRGQAGYLRSGQPGVRRADRRRAGPATADRYGR